MNASLQQLITKFGFKFGKAGVHIRRTMMLSELQLLFPITSLNSTLDEYKTEIIEYNCLHKPTKNTCKYTFSSLKELYSLDTSIPLFRVFRQLWDIDPSAQAFLALQLTYARDPLFRIGKDYILSHAPSEQIHRDEMMDMYEKNEPERFSPSSLCSVAKNVNSTWTQAGYLKGRRKKIRQIPYISAINVIYALFQGHLHGLSGERLFNSQWMKLLNTPLEKLKELASAASMRGLIDYKESGDVIDVRFNDYLNQEDEQLLQELHILLSEDGVLDE